MYVPRANKDLLDCLIWRWADDGGMVQKELMELGVQGTLNVMRSCVKSGTVKRVVLTSSTAAVSSKPLEGDGHVLDEESWSDVEYLTAKRTGLWVRTASRPGLDLFSSEF